MRTIRYVFLAVLALVLITVALANRAIVPLTLLPAEIVDIIASVVPQAAAIPVTVKLPMFVIIFGAIIVGILLGAAWEWFREHKHRSAATTYRREKEHLAREVSKFKVDKAKEEGDEVLALLNK
jgi:uncharacterized integral membrane protein